MNRKVMLMILDGWGIGEDYEGNAIKKAKTPNMDLLLNSFPNTQIEASGEYVGLPKGQMGNSEVGHLNIGAGRIVYQDLLRITKAIEDGSFFTNNVLVEGINNAKKNGKKLHLMGLLSRGGVHSHFDHLLALIILCKKMNFKDVYVHAFLDGRDVAPDSGVKYIEELENILKELGIGTLASISGRYYAMDRDKRWERIQKVYDLLTEGKGLKNKSLIEEVKKSYSENITDEFVIPCIKTVEQEGKEKDIVHIEDGDSVMFFNFRPDRARQLSRVFTDKEFKEFPLKNINLNFSSMTEYDKTLTNVNIAFKQNEIKNTLGEVIAKAGLKQLRTAETEKYAHVTFFFNGGVEKPNLNEDRDLIASPKVATYDLKPEMSSIEVTENVIKRIEEKKYDLIVLNFANPDMVGHTGVLDAAIKACEAIDKNVGEIAKTTLKNGYDLLITADHGNVEKMIDPTNGKVFTAHTSNPVPLVLVTSDLKYKFKNEGKLSDIAPTILGLMGIEKPNEMTGVDLLEKY